MEPLRVFTMEMSWGGWKAVSGLKAIRLGSWLMTDHMAALEPNFSRNSTEDPMLGLSVVTNNRAEMSWGLLDTPLWEEVSHEEMVKLRHPTYTDQIYPVFEQWQRWKKHYLLPRNYSFLSSSCLSWLRTVFMVYFLVMM